MMHVLLESFSKQYFFHKVNIFLALNKIVNFWFLLGMMYFHEDSTTATYDTFHMEMANKLKIDNRPLPYDYIHINDREAALKNSKEKHFTLSLFLFCHKHMSDNLIANVSKVHFPRNSEVFKDIVNHIMGDMAGCESIEEFNHLKSQVPQHAFSGNYFQNFSEDMWNYMVEPRLKAKLVIPKFLKTNAIEALNARIKLEIEHTPRPLPELVFMMKELVQEIKENMMMALYNEGKWRIAPNSKLKPVSRACWDRWAEKPGKQDNYFNSTVCAHKTHLSGQKTVLNRPKIPDQTNLSKTERKESRQVHKEALHLYNEDKHAAMVEKSNETGVPVFNINSQVKMKISQNNRPTCNRTREMYNHYPKQVRYF